MNFLSERNLEMHREYLNNLILRYNVFEKSYPELRNAKPSNIRKTRIRRSELDAAQSLFFEIEHHKIFFSSFCDRRVFSERVRKEFGTSENFIYKLKCKAETIDCGFLCVCESRGRISFLEAKRPSDLASIDSVKLSLDLCEHAYFYDYGFDKNAYVEGAVSHFDLGKL